MSARPSGKGSTAAEKALSEVRKAALALPEVTERLSHGAPTFFVRDKKTFVNFVDHHHGDNGVAIWAAAPEGVQATLVETEPERFFRPPYVGGRGWIGVRLDIDVDWAEIEQVIEDAYRAIASKKLIAELDSQQ